MSEPTPSLKRTFAAAFILLLALVPVLWFYVAVDVTHLWTEWEHIGRKGGLRFILFTPIVLYAILFAQLVRWLKREKND